MGSTVQASYDNPPKSFDVEARLIYTLLSMSDPQESRVQQALLRLNDDCFMSPDAKALFKIILELFYSDREFSFITVPEGLPNDLFVYVQNLAANPHYTNRHLEDDVEELLRLRELRMKLKCAADAINYSRDALTTEDALKIFTERLQKLSQINTSKQNYVRSYEQIVDEFLSETVNDDSEIRIAIDGLPPVPNRALITVAGRSGHGKTFFIIELMDKLLDALPNKQALYFNLEMHESVMVERHATILGIHGDSRKETIRNAAAALLQKNVSLISEPMISIEEIETECRLAALRQPIGVIVVDYIGLIRSKTKTDSKHQEQLDIAKRLAALSIELNCVVIAAIQVNRDYKTRQAGDRCPQVTDAADSMGSVHSSSWWLGIDQPQVDSDDDDFTDLFQIRCRKNRGDAGLFSLNLRFKGGQFSKWQKRFAANYKQKLDETVGF